MLYLSVTSNIEGTSQTWNLVYRFDLKCYVPIALTIELRERRPRPRRQLVVFNGRSYLGR